MNRDIYITEIERLRDVSVRGVVFAISGLLLEVRGLNHMLSIGARARVYGLPQSVTEKGALAEVVGFRGDTALFMPYSSIEGIGPGARVEVIDAIAAIYPTPAWKGRIINAHAEPLDGLGPLPRGTQPYALRAIAPPAHARRRVQNKLNVGVRSINTFLTCCVGQRMGVFAGSGVGKSILMSMLARGSQADVNVVGLIGECGRELQEFLQEDLAEEGLARSVVVVSTSDEHALMRRQAAYVTLAVAEFFRDQGDEVLCLMDSVTRFAMAQREIGLSAGEPPTTKGYTPTVFAELPKLLERAGPGKKNEGNITGLFTVLVEGDDTNEPVSDTVRGILDGHIVLDRVIAQRGRYPAVNILRSVSRTMPACNTDKENALVQLARNVIVTYEDMAEMIRLGAYRKGTDPQVDQAMQYYPAIEKFLSQRKDEKADLATGYAELAKILGVPWP